MYYNFSNIFAGLFTYEYLSVGKFGNFITLGVYFGVCEICRCIFFQDDVKN